LELSDWDVEEAVRSAQEHDEWDKSRATKPGNSRTTDKELKINDKKDKEGGRDNGNHWAPLIAILPPAAWSFLSALFGHHQR
jgi:hypothetical protein